MLRAIEQLTSGEKTRVGNHRVETLNQWGRTISNYIYHNTIICSVNENEKTFKTSNGGWGTQSTTRAINDYQKYFKSRGYRDLNESEDKSC